MNKLISGFLTAALLVSLSPAWSQEPIPHTTQLAKELTKASEDVMQPGDNLVVEGIPPIPIALADKIDRYGEFRIAGVGSWHPTKREMLMTTRFCETTQVHYLKQPGGARKQLTFFRDGVRTAVFEPTKGDYFIFHKDKHGNEFYQIYRYDLATNEMTMLTDGKSRNTGGKFSNAGNLIVYGSTRRNGSDFDLYTVDPKNAQSTRMIAQLTGGGWYASDWAPDDKTILVEEEVSVAQAYLWLLNVSTGEKRLLTPDRTKEQASYHGGQFSADGKTVYTTTDRDGEFNRLTAIDVETGKHSYLTSHINWDVDDYELSYDGKHLAFTTNEDGMSVLHIMDTATGKDRVVQGIPIGGIGGLQWHKNNTELVYDFDTTKSPSNIFTYNVTTGSIEQWTDCETGSMNTAAFSEPELVRWKSFDQRMISGFLYKPPAKFTGKRPVLVTIHGGPEGQFRPSFLGRLNYFGDEMGIACIYPNIRGSVGYGKTFLSLDNGFKREDSYKDINALFDWIATRPDLDSERIMVTGTSYGGHMTLAIAAFYGDRIRCARDVVGPSNLVTFLQNTQGYRRDLRRVEYGDERDPKMKEFLEKIAPMNSAHLIKKPLYVVQGKNDPRVPASESLQVVAAVRKNGTPVWFLMAKDEGHGFGRKSNVDYLFYSTAMFMKQFLLD